MIIMVSQILSYCEKCDRDVSCLYDDESFECPFCNTELGKFEE
jgi:anaerobic ribonucleoside-triphosphate reductase